MCTMVMPTSTQPQPVGEARIPVCNMGSPMSLFNTGPVSALEYLPQRRDLSSLREAAQECRGCDLYQRATQVVFGEGQAHASLFLVGEQPGDREDQQGKPFVGPAGQLRD